MGGTLKSKIVTALMLVLFCSLLIAPSPFRFQAVKGDNQPTLFADDFDGTQVDPEKWVTQENTNMSGLPAYGGSIKVGGSQIALSSDGSSFPFVYSATNPFPMSGDFAIELLVNYNHVGVWGNGLWITREPYTYYDIFAPEKSIFVLWADDENIYDHAGIKGYLLGREVYHSEAYGSLSLGYKMGPHVYRLEYLRGVYTLLVDGSEVASAPSQSMPEIIGFGHPPVQYLPFSKEGVSYAFSNFGGWTSFEMDYIRILRQATISMSTSTSSTTLGFSVDVSGKLDSIEGAPLPDANIILSYKFPGSTEWTQTTSAITSQDGFYTATWLPTATGSFTVKAEWPGNEVYAGTYEIRNISVTRDNVENLMLAESNSTLSALTVNSDSGEISFSVSGPSGTSGYVRFLISKSLLGNTTNLKVYMDGKQVEYSASSLGDLQLLYFAYDHSTHEVMIKLPEPRQEFSIQDGSSLPILVLLLASVIGVLLSIVIARKRLQR